MSTYTITVKRGEYYHSTSPANPLVILSDSYICVDGDNVSKGFRFWSVPGL